VTEIAVPAGIAERPDADLDGRAAYPR